MGISMCRRLQRARRTSGLQRFFRTDRHDVLNGPTLIMDYRRNSGTVNDGIHRSDLTDAQSVIVEFSYSADITPCELSHIVIFATSPRRPTFPRHVSHIVGMSAEKQMFGIDAKSVVALVANADIICQRPNEQNPRKTMRSVMSPLESARPVFASRVLGSCPYPTRISSSSLFNLSHESGYGPLNVLAPISSPSHSCAL